MTPIVLLYMYDKALYSCLLKNNKSYYLEGQDPEVGQPGDLG